MEKKIQKNESNINKKNKKKNKWKQVLTKNKKSIILIILLAVIIYLATVVVQLVKNPTNTFLVEKGKIYQEEIATGYIIREETVVKGQNYKNGMAQMKAEGERVAKGEDIFRYYSKGEDSLLKKIEELDKKINEAMEKEKNPFSSGDTKVLDNQISEKIENCYHESDLQKIKEYKKDINTYITKKAKIAGEQSPNGSYLKKLIDERKKYENSLNTGAEYVKSPISGVVSYRVDGYEQALTTKEFGKISKDFLEKIDLKTGQIIVANDESGKIINNYECYIATILHSEQSMQAKIGDEVDLRLPSGNEVEAEIEYINRQDDNEYLIIFKLDKCVEELISYRKISFDIIWWSHSGKKIPNSAIKYEEKSGKRVAYVIRTRAGYQDKIWIKELKSNGKYTIVADYNSEELEELGYTSEEIKSRGTISMYDEILINP